MKFALASDMHLDFGGIDKLPVKAEGTRTLVLAGDIVEAVLLKEKTAQVRRIYDYFAALNDNFDVILYVMGNHEHYGNLFVYTKQNLISRFKEHGLTNFHVLERETFEVEDTIFFGATMWTRMRNESPMHMNAIGHGLNDYHCIYSHQLAWGEKQKLIPEDTIAECKRTRDKIQEFIDLKTDKKKVLITHHAPSYESVPDRYKMHQLNEAYVEDISNMLYDSDIKVAVHGHIHFPACYTIGNTYVVSNPRGYFPSEPESHSWDFEIVNV